MLVYLIFGHASSCERRRDARKPQRGAWLVDRKLGQKSWITGETASVAKGCGHGWSKGENVELRQSWQRIGPQSGLVFGCNYNCDIALRNLSL